MDILSLITNLTNNFNDTFSQNINFFNIESKIKSIGDNFTKDLYIQYIEYMDNQFAKSKYRKDNYTIKEKTFKSILTSFGWITFKHRIYINRNTNERYSFIRDLLHIKPYQRITDEAEYELTKYAMSENMAQAARHAILGEQVSRSIVSKKIKNFKGTIHEDIKRTDNTPRVLYIEMDEIHANLQDGTNKICPCAIVHEGHIDNSKKRKQLKNVHNFASAKLNYAELWEVIYDYISKKYDMDKIEYLFVSGDGASGIKDFDTVFPNAIFVLDKFHYKKWLKYIFKLTDKVAIADSYIRNRDIASFNLLVNIEIENNPDRSDYIKQKQTSILNNIEGIINQQHPEYKCPCAMEGHVSNRYARYITSSPFAFSLDGLENKLLLLVLNANKHNLSFDEFITMKYGDNEYHEILTHINSLTNIKFRQTLFDTKKNIKLANISVPLPSFDLNETNDYFNTLVSKHILF